MSDNHIGLKQFAKDKNDLIFYSWANKNKDRFPFIIIRRTVFVDEKVLELLFAAYEIAVKKPNNQKHFEI